MNEKILKILIDICVETKNFKQLEVAKSLLAELEKPEPAGEAMEKIFMANSVMCPDTSTPYYDKRIKMWVIRLQETIADASIEAVQYKMQRKLEAYRAACGLTSPAVSKIDELYRKIGCLEAENAELKRALKIITIHCDDPDTVKLAENALKAGE